MELKTPKEWAAKQIDERHKKITLVVTDIEGCLNLNERTYDFEALEWIRHLNEFARPDNALPFVTVCSGRQCAFVEATIRIIGGRIPALFENGCGIFFPDRPLLDEYEWHPLLSDPNAISQFSRVREVISDLCAKTGARKVIGKEFLLSLHPRPPMRSSEFRGLVDHILHKEGLVAATAHSASAVDIAPEGIDKAAGLEWLISVTARSTQFSLQEMAGIGDSDGDLSFLRLLAFPAAPANAAPEVKALAAYCSANQDGQGVVDIIRQCIAMNLDS